MRITQFHIYCKALPVKNGPYTMSGQVVHSLDTTIIRLVADNGLEGWGEVCPVGPLYAPIQAGTIRASLQEIGEALIGLEVSINAARRAIDKCINGQNYARSAIDIAVHDLLGKFYEVPVYDLLGGAIAKRMPSYYATGVGSPDEVAKITREKIAEGYPRIQIKAGRENVEEDIETIRKVHGVSGNNASLAVDANRGLLGRDAIRISRACADIPFVFEQPCETIEEMAAIRPLLSHPLFMDESIVDLNTALRVIGEGLVDGFGMKVSRLGGLAPFATFRDICRARTLPHTCDDSWGGDIVAAACAHIGATVDPKLLEAVWLATPYVDGTYLQGDPFTVHGGHVEVPEGPGLGIIVDPDKVGTLMASFGA
jgi:L-alanine-DL-glutamate epimerase-like enolase superfamily enzyme